MFHVLNEDVIESVQYAQLGKFYLLPFINTICMKISSVQIILNRLFDPEVLHGVNKLGIAVIPLYNQTTGFQVRALKQQHAWMFMKRTPRMFE